MRSGIGHEALIVSAHRTPDRLYEFAKGARDKGFKIVIAGAGGAAHLPGMAASMTSLPVLGVPMNTHALEGKDSLLSIVQMPAGIPVGTLAIGKPGAINAGSARRRDALAVRHGARETARSPSARARPPRSASARKTEAIHDGSATFSAAQGRRDHRHSRRRPARPHAGAGRRAARPALPCLCAGEGFLRLRSGAAPRSRIIDDKTSARRYSRATCDVITYEFENVPAECAAFLAQPQAGAARSEGAGEHAGPPDREGFHRRAEDRASRPMRRCIAPSQLEAAHRKIGLPAVLKTRTLGYDGKGQAIDRQGRRPARGLADAQARALHPRRLHPIRARDFGRSSRARIDGKVRKLRRHRERASRSHSEDLARFPPASPPALAKEARRIAEKLAKALRLCRGHGGRDVRGARGKSRAVLVNEIAPRVHNSGHWTLDGASVSQFEQHIRAVAGWPLAKPVRRGRVEMTNLIGAGGP